MAEEIIVKVKLVPDNTAIEKYLYKLGKTSIAMKGIGGAGGPSGGGKEVDDAMKKNLKIFKADLLLRWIRRIWQIAEKNIPFMNVLQKMNNSLIRLFLVPPMLEILKILKPIYMTLFDLAEWWVKGGFKQVMAGIFPEAGKTAPIAPKAMFALLGLEGFAKIGAILLRKVEEAFLEILTKTKGKILAFAEKWGLTEIYTLVKTQIGKIFDPLISTASKLLEPVLTKISGIFAVVGTHAGNVGGLFNKVGGILTVFADRLIWAGLIVDVIKWISDSLLEWINDPFWRTVLIYISNLTAVMSPLIDVIGWIWDAFSDLFHILTTGKLEFNNLFARFREVGEAFRVFVGTTRSILSGIGVLGGARANGGPVNGGQSYLVGEKGPEIFTPGTGGSITPNNKMGGGASIGNINITINTSKIDSSNLNQLSKEISDKIYADVRRRVTF